LSGFTIFSFPAAMPAKGIKPYVFVAPLAVERAKLENGLFRF
jgi:hypothetical protein